MLQMVEQAARPLPGALSVHSQGYAHKAKPMCRLPALLDGTPRGGESQAALVHPLPDRPRRYGGLSVPAAWDEKVAGLGHFPLG